MKLEIDRDPTYLPSVQASSESGFSFRGFRDLVVISVTVVRLPILFKLLGVGSRGLQSLCIDGVGFSLWFAGFRGVGLSGLRIENLSSFVANCPNIRCCCHGCNQLVHSEYARVSNTFFEHFNQVLVLFSETACCIRLQPPRPPRLPQTGRKRRRLKMQEKSVSKL